jgi:predicted amidohydrolase
MTRVVLQQPAPVVGELAHNRALAIAAIRAAVADGADLVVLPELVTSGYVFASATEAASMAVAADDPLLEEWAAAVRPAGAVVVGGFCERGGDGRLHNSAAVVDGTGVRAVYRKTHLWDREKLVFAPGDDPPPVVDTAHGRIGVLVCYDLEFPELTRGLALGGADLIAVPTNWPLVPRPAGEHPPEVIIGMAAARTNRIFVACCDRAGVERGQEWTSGTAIIDQDGWVVAETTQEGAIAADLDLSLARDKRVTEHAHLHGDRRPELYAAVAEAPGLRP